jgi:ABC-type glycerol-3-phosphate transport system substrate-binding protein
MNKMKKLTALLLALLLILTVTACGQTSQQNSSSSFSSSDDGETAGINETGEVDPDNPWKNLVDTSKEETVVVYVLGDKPNDYDRVIEQVNDRLMELVNTKIEINFIALSDYATKYPLVLTGGDEIDLIYASSWCFFTEQVGKGAYVELTDDFIQKYMPKTWELEPEAAWKQVAVNGKVYAVPRNQTENQNYGGFLVRKDMMEKYNIDDITTFDEYEEYLFTLAENETDAYALYAFPSLPMKGMLMMPFENMFTVYNNICWDADNGTAKVEDCEFLYTTEEYHDYVLRMAEWAKRGVWPSNAISGSTHTQDLFVEGKSLSFPCRTPESDNIIRQAEAKGYEVDYVTCLPEGVYTRRTAYNGDCMAIASFSKNPERAAVVLDIMKNDEQTNLLCVGGIEGVHYVINEDGSRSNGPESDNYAWDNWSWSIRNDWNPPLERLDMVKEVEEEYEERLMPDEMWIFDGFSTNNDKYSAEIAVINSIITEYDFSFDLGVFGDDTEAKYQEFVQKLNDAGLEVVWEDWMQQLNDFVGES